MTQHEKILDMHQDGNWHCGNAYRALYIFSPHKRRAEIVEHKVNCAMKGWEYEFKPRPCVHGYKNVLDYLLVISRKKKEEVKPAAPVLQPTLI